MFHLRMIVFCLRAIRSQLWNWLRRKTPFGFVVKGSEAIDPVKDIRLQGNLAGVFLIRLTEFKKGAQARTA